MIVQNITPWISIWASGKVDHIYFPESHKKTLDDDSDDSVGEDACEIKEVSTGGDEDVDIDVDNDSNDDDGSVSDDM